MSKLPGRRLLVLISPGFSADSPEIRSAAAVSIESVVESAVILNVFNPQDTASVARGEHNTVLEELTSATGGLFFSGSWPPSNLSQYPELLYLLDVLRPTIRSGGSLHLLKVVCQSSDPIRARKTFVAPSPVALESLKHLGLVCRSRLPKDGFQRGPITPLSRIFWSSHSGKIERHRLKSLRRHRRDNPLRIAVA